MCKLINDLVVYTDNELNNYHFIIIIIIIIIIIWPSVANDPEGWSKELLLYTDRTLPDPRRGYCRNRCLHRKPRTEECIGDVLHHRTQLDQLHTMLDRQKHPAEKCR